VSPGSLVSIVSGPTCKPTPAALKKYPASDYFGGFRGSTCAFRLGLPELAQFPSLPG